MSDEILQVNFRMPASLKNRLEEAAKVTGRSLTSEIVTRLEDSLDNCDAKSPPVAMNVMFDDDWFDATGLTKEEFGSFVKMAVHSGVSQYKVDKDD